ncbi:zinc finger protein 235-like [Topomyia yanbarensis]|uniref:zinc finger protein 235-like n=1 Tax=Topomyia yanbarensis TaxID=2498891 RepID=UPI00273CF1BC|nr:zinc finger protein 235-like [Topomyia yanbarensis]XP_058825153.1 zinc finger protein 235-like [Topomyia yanbarensis]XP_058825154.1 zinc finger protein 235-like [Topomyia yanbarensis]XP_058825155.1 zinc finger protein 235-like [Topomyia yanbarensis]
MTELVTRILMPESCRCCLLEQSEMFCILDTMEEFGSTICDLIASCIGITITEHDGFSRSICNACFNDLSTAVRFRQRCLKTEDILRNTQIDIEKPQVKEAGEIQGAQQEDQKILKEIHSECSSTDHPSIDYQSSAPGLSSQMKDVDIEPIKLAVQPAAKPRRHHPGGPHKCDLCGKVFNRANYLSKHLRIHTGERPYKCTFCPRSFVASDNFKKHIRLHTNNRPHKCDLCDKRFVSNSLLTRHKISHTSEQTYRCDVCGKDCSSNIHLYNHRFVHTGGRRFGCTLCDKIFAVRSKLNKHMLTHTDEKPFQCDICGKNFKREDGLKSHLRVHVGPQRCDICGEEFLKAFPFKLHRKMHSIVGNIPPKNEFA